MPLPKRVVEPVHVSRGTIPEDFPLPSELETLTNGTLANTVRQLSSLSKHAEDLFGELARDAAQINDRSNSLQARIDRLAVKVTQLDSTVEEVSLQDIHMRKAFKSAVVFDQQIFSRATMPTAMLETYKTCDKPPPLDKLNCYREDGKDGLKFYTDPNYFFDLWKEEILKDTERMMHDRGKKPHRPRTEGGQGGRHKKRVRQPHNTRERQRQIAVGHGEHIMPQNITYRAPQLQPQNPLYVQQQQQQHQQQQQQQIDEAYLGVTLQDPRPPRPNSIEIRRSYQTETIDGIYSPHQPGSPSEHYHITATSYDEVFQQQIYNQAANNADGMYGQASTPTRTPVNKIRPTQPPPAPPSNSSTPSASNTPTRGRSMSTGRETLPPPPPPPETVMSPPNGVPAHLLSRRESGSRSNSPHSHTATPEPPISELPPPPPIPRASPPKQESPTNAPPPPPLPPPPPVAPVTTTTIANGPSSPPMINGDTLKIMGCSPPKLSPIKDRINVKAAPIPMVDPRNDLLKAIRDGIKLRKVEKNEQKEVERGNGLHDVASILARRVAVEFSDSDSASESEYDSDGWGENETSA